MRMTGGGTRTSKNYDLMNYGPPNRDRDRISNRKGVWLWDKFKYMYMPLDICNTDI